MSDKFVVAIVSPDTATLDTVASLLEASPLVEAAWRLAAYPEPHQLKQLPQARGKCILFLDFCDPVRAKATAAEVDSSCPAIQVVAVHRGGPPDTLRELMRLGIREVVDMPPAASEIDEILHRKEQEINRLDASGEGTGRIFAFLPAKPGVGASTLAVHCSAAAARLSSGRTLLADLDLRLGMTSFLLKLDASHSVADALAMAGQLDHNLWERLVNRRGSLDILGSAPIEFQEFDPETGTAGLLDYARRIYTTICVDLPGEMRGYELDTLRRAKECFLVCTGDVGTLHLAKRKADFLKAQNFDRKTSVILNRSGGRGFMPAKDIEAILRLPIRFSVANAEKEMAEVTQTASVLEGKAAVVAQIENIARHLLPADPARAAATSGRKFIEFFSVTPTRDRVAWRK